MYIELKQDKRCSKCNALNLFEEIWRDNLHLIRCRNCLHEKIIGTLYTTNPFIPASNPIVYQMPEQPKEESF